MRMGLDPGPDPEPKSEKITIPNVSQCTFEVFGLPVCVDRSVAATRYVCCRRGPPNLNLRPTYDKKTLRRNEERIRESAVEMSKREQRAKTLCSFL